MNCPVCDGRLRAVEKHGVEVDICPECKGVWLDRGELEKILSMASQDGVAAYPETAPQQRDPQPERQERYIDQRSRESHDYDEDRHHEHGHDREQGQHGQGGSSEGQGKRRKGAWLSDILDSFGGGE